MFDKEKFKKWITDKKNWQLAVGLVMLCGGAFMHAGLPAMIFIIGLVLILSADA